MATDVKNTNGAGSGNTGNVKNGRITVAGNKKNYQYQDAPSGNVEYEISKFDLNYAATSNPVDGAGLDDRFDDPRYYVGDATT